MNNAGLSINTMCTHNRGDAGRIPVAARCNYEAKALVVAAAAPCWQVSVQSCCVRAALSMAVEQQQQFIQFQYSKKRL